MIGAMFAPAQIQNCFAGVEEQLAAHLEERRRRLVELQEQTRQEREAFQAAHAAAEAEQAAVSAVHALGLRDGIAFPQLIVGEEFTSGLNNLKALTEK